MRSVTMNPRRGDVVGWGTLSWHCEPRRDGKYNLYRTPTHVGHAAFVVHTVARDELVFPCFDAPTPSTRLGTVTIGNKAYTVIYPEQHRL